MTSGTTKLTAESIVVVTPKQTTADLGEAIAVLHLETKRYFTLEKTGQKIWERLGTPTSVQELTRWLCESHAVDEGQCERDLLVFLEDLRSAGLILDAGVSAGGP